MMMLDLDEDALQRVLTTRFEDPDEAWLDYYNAIVSSPPDGLNVVEHFVQAAHGNHDHLCFIGVAFVEPLLELHWRVFFDAFVEATKTLPDLRKALSCAWLHIDDASTALKLQALVRESDDIRYG